MHPSLLLDVYAVDIFIQCTPQPRGTTRNAPLKTITNNTPLPLSNSAYVQNKQIATILNKWSNLTLSWAHLVLVVVINGILHLCFANFCLVKGPIRIYDCPVWILAQSQTDIQTGRKWCTIAHRAYAQVCSKKTNVAHTSLEVPDTESHKNCDDIKIAGSWNFYNSHVHIFQTNNHPGFVVGNINRGVGYGDHFKYHEPQTSNTKRIFTPSHATYSIFSFINNVTQTG